MNELLIAFACGFAAFPIVEHWLAPELIKRTKKYLRNALKEMEKKK